MEILNLMNVKRARVAVIDGILFHLACFSGLPLFLLNLSNFTKEWIYTNTVCQRLITKQLVLIPLEKIEWEVFTVTQKTKRILHKKQELYKYMLMNNIALFDSEVCTFIHIIFTCILRVHTFAVPKFIILHWQFPEQIFERIWKYDYLM